MSNKNLIDNETTVEDISLIVKSCLDKKSYKYEFTEKNVAIFNVTAENYSWSLAIYISNAYVTIMATAPVHIVRETDIEKVVLALNSENLSLPLGNFELRKNKLNYKLATPVRKQYFSVEMIDDMMGYAIAIADNRVSKIIKIYEAR